MTQGTNQNCVAICRSIIVRRCGSADATVWSQQVQACIKPRPVGGPQVQPPRDHGAAADGRIDRHPRRLVFGENRRGNTAAAAASNRCRQGGPAFYRPHPTNSSMYIQCSATGRAFIRKCPTGLRWNQRAMTCDRSAPGTMH